MAGITESLRAQHEAVRKLSETLDDALAHRRLVLVSATLSQLRTALLAHLRQEDQELYPPLRRLANDYGGEQTAKTVELFAQSIPQITQALTEFLGRYEGVIVDLAHVTRDWNAVKPLLTMRMQSEETVLYPLFEKLDKPAA